ncbi:MAG TPA: enoyl-CoA hydratase/isomerase family protein [Acidimicrobiia bacterium]|nr:enoyl-CoA hydratase/isomerase family protein [Acidimicrobiia bacterium]
MENPFAHDVLIDEEGPVCVVTLNRPEALNASNPALHRAMARIWRHLAGAAELRAVVLTGAGRAFCAGGDMELFKALESDPASRRFLLDEAAQVVTEMAAFPLPVVAAVNGPAVGLGANLALLCDLVVMGESAYLCDPHVSVGLTAADGGAPLWPLFTSILKVKEYLFTGARIPAADAAALGFANRVVPDGDVLESALELAGRLAGQPAHALRTTKRAINMHITRAVTGVLEYALAEEFTSFDTAEHRAAVARFRKAPAP